MTGEMRTCRCVCGGSITAPADDWDTIATEVRLHNATPMHEAWRLGLAYRAAPLPADWHYVGGRDLGTRVPYAKPKGCAFHARVDVDCVENTDDRCGQVRGVSTTRRMEMPPMMRVSSHTSSEAPAMLSHVRAS